MEKSKKLRALACLLAITVTVLMLPVMATAATPTTPVKAAGAATQLYAGDNDMIATPNPDPTASYNSTTNTLVLDGFTDASAAAGSKGIRGDGDLNIEVYGNCSVADVSMSNGNIAISGSGTLAVIGGGNSPNGIYSIDGNLSISDLTVHVTDPSFNSGLSAAGYIMIDNADVDCTGGEAISATGKASITGSSQVTATGDDSGSLGFSAGIMGGSAVNIDLGAGGLVKASGTSGSLAGYKVGGAIVAGLSAAGQGTVGSITVGAGTSIDNGLQIVNLPSATWANTVAIGTAGVPASSAQLSGNATYTITATADAGGTISPSGSVQVRQGASQAFTIKPNTDFHVADVLVNGKSEGAIETYTFSNVSQDGSIAATFEHDSNEPDTDIEATGVKTVASVYLVKGKSVKLPAAVQPFNATDKDVAWTSSNAKVAKVNSATGKVTAAKNAVGKKATITVITNDGDFTAKCTVHVVSKAKALKSFKVSPKKELGLVVGKTKQAKVKLATKKATGIVPVFSSSKKKVAVIDKAGVITALAPGKTVIKVKIGKKTQKFTLTVGKVAAKKIVLNKKSATVKAKKTVALKVKSLKPAKVAPKTIKWATSNKKVATVNSKGVVKGIKKGKATITAKTWNGKTAKCKVTVK